MQANMLSDSTSLSYYFTQDRLRSINYLIHSNHGSSFTSEKRLFRDCFLLIVYWALSFDLLYCIFWLPRREESYSYRENKIVCLFNTVILYKPVFVFQRVMNLACGHFRGFYSSVHYGKSLTQVQSVPKECQYIHVETQWFKISYVILKSNILTELVWELQILH